MTLKDKEVYNSLPALSGCEHPPSLHVIHTYCSACRPKTPPRSLKSHPLPCLNVKCAGSGKMLSEAGTKHDIQRFSSVSHVSQGALHCAVAVCVSHWRRAPIEREHQRPTTIAAQSKIDTLCSEGVWFQRRVATKKNHDLLVWLVIK